MVIIVHVDQDAKKLTDTRHNNLFFSIHLASLTRRCYLYSDSYYKPMNTHYQQLFLNPILWEHTHDLTY